MLPNIDCQQWHQAFGQWIVGVTRFHHFETDVIAYQPCPPTAEMTDRDIGKFFLARFYAAERGFHFCLEGRGWFPTALRFKTAPIERMIPSLGRIVEDVRAVGVARGSKHYPLKRQIREFCPHDQFVRVLNIGPVMLSVV